MNSFVFFDGFETYKFKGKGSEIIAALLCLGNLSKYFSVGNIKTTRLYGYVYNFSVDYDSIDVNYILDIHIYLMKKDDRK